MKKILLCLFPLSAFALEKEPRTMPANGIDKALLGQILFFDNTLSFQRNLNCASCHSPDHAFVDIRENSGEKMVSQGDDLVSFGKRNSPTMLYAKFSPEFYFDEKNNEYIGGQFWDGRAKHLQEQAGMPPIDPAEMAMPNKLSVAKRLLHNPMYANLFTQHYGQSVWESPESVYHAMEDALMVFQRDKKLLAPFDSQYDKYLKGEYQLSALEQKGMELFFDKAQTSCSNCHQRHAEAGQNEETFSNYRYYNIGVPSNKRLISHNNLPKDFVDYGLFENPRVKGDSAQKGKFKVPTLRNVAVTAPYMHNGIFKELRTTILFFDHFNNPDRKENPETRQPWAEAEYSATFDKSLLKGKALNDEDIDALEAFLKVLTDERYQNLLK